MNYKFFVPGIPVPKGSAKAFLNKYTGKIAVMQDNRDKQKPWASMIGHTAIENNVGMLEGSIGIDLVFIMPRIKAHYTTKGLRGNAPLYHKSKPDLDKLIRCVKDALTGIAWKDDSQVAEVYSLKKYGDAPGVTISIREIREGL